MENKDLYDNIFLQTFNLSLEEIYQLDYENYELWDSLTNMELITKIENAFHIVFSPDEVFDFHSYQSGLEILKKRNLLFKD